MYSDNSSETQGTDDPDNIIIKSPYDMLKNHDISEITQIFCNEYEKSMGLVEKKLSSLKKECTLNDGVNISISNKGGILLKFNYNPGTRKVTISNISTPDDIYQSFLCKLPEKYKPTTEITD